MAGRKRRRVKLLSETIMVDRRVGRRKKKELEEQRTWSELPSELLELILSHLNLKQNIRTSVVCKNWLPVAIAVRVANKPPWLMYFPKSSGDLYEFYDPEKRKTCSLKLPQLHESSVCYAKDGWLLLHRCSTRCVFFFNPFTQELIRLPRFRVNCQRTAFSSAPTSPGCIVCTIWNIGPMVVEISTCRPGDTEWTTVNYGNCLPSDRSSIGNRLVFCNGLFYSLGLTNWMGIFDALERTWINHDMPPPECLATFSSENWWKGKFFVEHEGDIIAVCTSCSERPTVFKLDQMNKTWEETKTLDGATLFASSMTSQARSYLVGMMRNSIYFSKVRFYGKRCMSYSLSDHRYYPSKQGCDWGEQDPSERIWIDPPENFSTLM